ncbi:transcription factor bHLH130-like [Impatiens glandulifera]|uniref:transcription factor bHLH130-like n=1 Tax=Impatiens glandulifera TaxID=253017 RepID=UPI001FB06A49|nr:transcription factor bHLH130-like [Impatiens glandulifera]
MKKEIAVNADHYRHQTTGLVSYRSAPSSFFADLMDEGNGCEDLFSADETASMIASFMESTGSLSESGSGDFLFEAKVKPEEADECPLVVENGHLTLASRTVCEQNQTARELERSIGAGGFHRVKSSDGGNYSNLMRQNSSPAGFFSCLNDGNGKADENFNGNIREENQPIARIREVNFSSAQCFSSRFIPQNEEEGVMDSNLERHYLEESRNINGYHVPEVFQSDSWINPSSTGKKRRREGNDMNENGIFNHSSHQETSSEWLQFQQDSVPCKLRARRGFATHPRSIAERTRRTRISDRMKKLQDLFPNMEKTSISDMLDLAVEHIKNLQKHVDMLTDNQSRCTCSTRQA